MAVPPGPAAPQLCCSTRSPLRGRGHFCRAGGTGAPAAVPVPCQRVCLGMDHITQYGFLEAGARAGGCLTKVTGARPRPCCSTCNAWQISPRGPAATLRAPPASRLRRRARPLRSGERCSLDCRPAARLRPKPPPPPPGGARASGGGHGLQALRAQVIPAGGPNRGAAPGVWHPWPAACSRPVPPAPPPPRTGSLQLHNS